MPEDITSKHAGVTERPNTDCTDAGTNQAGLAIMTWTCKMREAADKHINRFQLLMFIAATAIAAIPALNAWTSSRTDGLLIFCLIPYVATAVFVPMVRQKTVYNYRINEEQGECESYLYFPSFAGALFNGIAILGFVVVLAAAIMMQSLIPLLGAGAVGLSYAGRLLGWQPTITVDQSLLWKEYGCITLDYKRKMIVAHKTNIDIGFEFRFPDEKLFAEFLDFLKPRLRSDVEFLKRDWDAENFRRNWAKANKK